MEKEVEINGKNEVYLCNLWTWCLPTPISIDMEVSV